MSNYRYDTHCHIFTLEYAIKEVKSLCREIASGEYPLQIPAGGLSGDNRGLANKSRVDWHDLFELLRQLYELLSAALTSEKDNLKFLDEEMCKAYPDADPRTVPLMMDIFYMIATPLEKGKDMPQVLRAAAPEAIDMQADWDRALDALSDHVRKSRAWRSALFKSAADSAPQEQTTDAIFSLIERERNLSEDSSDNRALYARKPSGYSSRFSFHRTKGYCFHMDNLMSLVGTNPGKLYPFVAVDARRPQIVDDICSGNFFTGPERFYGVKLYPRLGCHPLSNPMFRVYEYCEAHNLPIIFHCGMGGFPPSEKWAYSNYGNPENFEPVLAKYPKLRIDFAHMGSGNTSAWKDAVMALINKYDNAYTDYSCYTDPTELAFMKKTYWDKNPKLQERLLFGTDFDVMYFTGRVTMQEYYDSFKNVFGNDMDRLMRDNPARFLGV